MLEHGVILELPAADALELAALQVAIMAENRNEFREGGQEDSVLVPWKCCCSGRGYLDTKVSYAATP